MVAETAPFPSGQKGLLFAQSQRAAAHKDHRVANGRAPRSWHTTPMGFAHANTHAQSRESIGGPSKEKGHKPKNHARKHYLEHGYRTYAYTPRNLAAATVAQPAARNGAKGKSRTGLRKSAEPAQKTAARAHAMPSAAKPPGAPINSPMGHNNFTSPAPSAERWQIRPTTAAHAAAKTGTRTPPSKHPGTLAAKPIPTRSGTESSPNANHAKQSAIG